MKLADYLHTHSITPQQLRTMLGVKSRSTVLRYISGERLPSPDLLQRIEELTGGAVTRADFLDPQPPGCLRVVIDRKGREQTTYPWTVLEARPQPPGPRPHPRPPAANDNRAQRPPPPPPPDTEDDWPSPPLQRALDLLGPRARHAKRGGFLLDGRIADTRRVMAAANEVLKARGEKPIPYPGVEPIW